MTIPVDKIRRDALSVGLHAARLPLTAAESVLKRGQDTSNWAPTVAFKRAEATVTAFVGELTHDDILIGRARLQRAEAEQRELVIAKQAQAEATRVDARADAEARQEQLEEKQADAEETERARKQRIEAERTKAERGVEQAATRKKAAARQQAATRRDAIAAKATEADAVRLRKEAEAIGAKERAVKAKGEVLALDRAVTAKKAARRAG